MYHTPPPAPPSPPSQAAGPDRRTFPALAILLTSCLAACSGAGDRPATKTILNVIPVADAGRDQNVTTGTSVALDGSGSRDPDGGQITYAWSFTQKPETSSAELSGADTVAPTFLADVEGIYVARLIVNDGTEDSDADFVVVVASTGNSAPAARAGPDQNVATGTPVTLDGSASSDADGDLLSYAWSFVSIPSGSGAVLNDPSTATPGFSTDVDGEYVVSLTVSDGQATSSPDTATITASTANSAPLAHAGPDQNPAIGATVTLDGSASSDPDGDPITYRWSLVSKPESSSATLSNGSTAAPSFVADVEGHYLLELVVSDGHAESAPDHVVVKAGIEWCDGLGQAVADTTGAASATDSGLATDGDTETFALLSADNGSVSLRASSGTVLPAGRSAGMWILAMAFNTASGPPESTKAAWSLTIRTYLDGELRETSPPRSGGYLERQYLSIDTVLDFDAVEVLFSGVSGANARNWARVFEICSDGGTR